MRFSGITSFVLLSIAMTTACNDQGDPYYDLAEATRRALANPGTATLPRDLLPA